MTAGYASARATSILNTLRNTTYTAIANVYVKLHTGDPGSAGTANASAVTTRNAITFNAPAGANPVSMTLASLSAFSMTTSETISHVSLWDASSGGNFLESWALSAGVPVINGSSLTFSTFTLSITPTAA